MKLIILRHGQTDWNLQSRFQGHSDIPLNQVGLAQAERAATTLSQLKIDRIISSDLGRAAETVRPLAKTLGLELELDARLRETQGGTWEGQTGAENRSQDGELFAAWMRGDDVAAGTTGESRSQVAARAKELALSASETGKTLLLATHGGTARALIGTLLELPVAAWTGIGGLSNACWSVLEFHPKLERWILVEHNAAALPEPLFSNET